VDVVGLPENNFALQESGEVSCYVVSRHEGNFESVSFNI
jgi:hypothetical protein